MVLALSAVRLDLSQHDHQPFRQKKHSPQQMVNGTTTRSPTLSFLLPEPTSTTSPMNSWPRTSPLCISGIYPSYKCKSEPQMAVEVTLTIASRGSSIRGSGTSSTRTSYRP